MPSAANINVLYFVELINDVRTLLEFYFIKYRP